MDLVESIALGAAAGASTSAAPTTIAFLNITLEGTVACSCTPAAAATASTATARPTAARQHQFTFVFGAAEQPQESSLTITLTGDAIDSVTLACDSSVSFALDALNEQTLPSYGPADYRGSEEMGGGMAGANLRAGDSAPGCRICAELGPFVPTPRGNTLTVATSRWSDFLNRIVWNVRVRAVPEAYALPRLAAGSGTAGPDGIQSSWAAARSAPK